MMGTNKNIAYYNEGVSVIKSRAHEQDEQLTQVIIGGCVKTVGAHSFSMCNNVRSLTLEHGIEEICEEAFSYCTGLKSVTIPGSVKTVGKNAFLYGANIACLTLGDGVKTIEDGAFRGLVELGSVVIPDSVEKIGSSAFKRCVNLTEVKLGAGLKEIGAEAFYGCSNLKCVVIPEGVTVGAGAFEDCGDITVIAEGVSYLNGGISSIYDPQTDYPEGEWKRRNEQTRGLLEYLENLAAEEDDGEELFGISEGEILEEPDMSVDDLLDDEDGEPIEPPSFFDGENAYFNGNNEYVMLNYDKLCKAAEAGMTVEELVDYIDIGEWDSWGEDDDPDDGDCAPEGFLSLEEGVLPNEDSVFATNEEAFEWLNNHSAPADDDNEEYEETPPTNFLKNLGKGLNGEDLDDSSTLLTDKQRRCLEELIESGITLDEFQKLCDSGKLFDE